MKPNKNNDVFPKEDTPLNKDLKYLSGKQEFPEVGATITYCDAMTLELMKDQQFKITTACQKIISDAVDKILEKCEYSEAVVEHLSEPLKKELYIHLICTVTKLIMQKDCEKEFGRREDAKTEENKQ